jgi:hypothetical protein
MKSLFIILSLSLIIFSQQADSIAIDAKVSEVTAGSNVACTIVFTFTSDSAGSKKEIGKIAGLVLAKSSDPTSTTPLTCALNAAKEISAGTPAEFACTAGTLVEGKYKLAKVAESFKITSDTGGSSDVTLEPSVTGTNEITVKASSGSGDTGGSGNTGGSGTTGGNSGDNGSKFLSVSGLLALILFF